ncbi:type II secretion system protein GspC [Marinibactrum halimedae]|uniref:Type II secretion system protein C n=1 Tax=Marinibactrum halimedae TaxID=1444977 RepID=A0AA37T7C3_9GAMM|nr:type II secretion system protein GspC [Marinibactrum halimedae]MCD9458252.1 type II secretion system protein GspC [Marinibactrum halimedae]GLS27121.1 type II secretion system protein C [Marinibactrum halimedae]
MIRQLDFGEFATVLKQGVERPGTVGAIRDGLIVLLLISACVSFAKLFWLMFPLPSLPDPDLRTPKNLVVSGQTQSTTSSNDINIQLLASAKIFGEVASNDTAAAPEPVSVGIEDDAVDTKLNLKLKGVVMSATPEQSRAMIEDGREEELYKVGDKLPGGSNVTLSKVLTDRVILSNAGRAESLWLFDPDGSLGGSSVSSGRGSSGRSASSSRPRSIRPGVSQPNTASRRSSGPGPQESRKISRLPKSLAEVIKFSVHRENGQIMGYKIRPGRDRDAFQELGLQTNDIVTEINGIALNSSGSVTQVYREMREATSADVTLLRGGQSMSLSVELDTN